MSLVSIIEWNKMNTETPTYVRGRIISRIASDLLKRGLYQEWQTGGETETLEAVKIEDVVLMQFTGLYDKNGKEIWEGDVVLDTHSISTGRKGFIEYGEGEFFLNYGQPGIFNRAISHFHRSDGTQVWNLLEVLGNIYENPELLEPIGGKS
jgi:uncharacterized phage protein (TIGR01671 family)